MSVKQKKAMKNIKVLVAHNFQCLKWRLRGTLDIKKDLVDQETFQIENITD